MVSTTPGLTISKIPVYASVHVNMFKNLFGVEFDFTPKSLSLLDTLIGAGWPDRNEKYVDYLTLLFGSYLGETIRKEHGGHWTFNDESGFFIRGIGSCGFKAYPFSKIRKRILNGKDESLATYYISLKGLIEADKKILNNSARKIS